MDQECEQMYLTDNVCKKNRLAFQDHEYANKNIYLRKELLQFVYDLLQHVTELENDGSNIKDIYFFILCKLSQLLIST